MSAIILQFPRPPSARVYAFPSARIVRVIAPAPKARERERLASLARLIAEELDKAPPRPKRRKPRQSSKDASS